MLSAWHADLLAFRLPMSPRQFPVKMVFPLPSQPFPALRHQASQSHNPPSPHPGSRRPHKLPGMGKPMTWPRHSASQAPSLAASPSRRRPCAKALAPSPTQTPCIVVARVPSPACRPPCAFALAPSPLSLRPCAVSDANSMHRRRKLPFSSRSPRCREPLFPGESGVDQLVEIIKVLGTPTREEIKCMNPNYTEFKFPQIKAHPWHKLFQKKLSPEGVDLVSRLLQYSPNLRCTPLEACAHPFFDDLRDANAQLPDGKPLPPLFDFKPQGNNG
ncbi:hypothetical protein Taro_036187 [Colocasia esculenta]|uniref:Uncharacterized protein n=1 Tax=Colocasia esculenta TaxID=4460 RepID=A0A843WFK5_COLES|nr:hypothetical protein [Colocasia esculenta]